jgi:pyruvate dehydrogenase E2 component (dihydrolipoamide acetyltransferase)
VAFTEVKVPDIGDFKDIPIIEIHVHEGDVVNAEDPLVTLESDKATMDVPAPSGGTVEAVLVKVGDRVSEGSAVLRLRGSEEGSLSQPTSLLPQQEAPAAPQPTPAPAAPAAVLAGATAVPDFAGVHAGPGVRRAARELDVDLNKVKGHRRGGDTAKGDAARGRGVPSGGAAAELRFAGRRVLRYGH